MNTQPETLEKLRFEMQTVKTEIKARHKSMKKLERETLQQVRELEMQTRAHTALINCQTEAYNKVTGLVKETVQDLNSILRNMIAHAKGEAPNNTADLIEMLELKLLDKAKRENTALLKINAENQKTSDQVPELAQQLLDTYNTEKGKAVEFSRQAQARVNELEESINKILNVAGNE